MSADAPEPVLFTDSGTPRSERYDDVYFSPRDGRAESAEAFLGGLGLPAAWAERGGRPYRLAELGFGLGLNCAVTLDAWRGAGAPVPLDYVAFEAAPPPAAAMRRALAPWPELGAWAEAWLGAWPPDGPEARWTLAPGATLTLLVGDARARLPEWAGRADGWYLDGFSPAKNPELWEAELLAAMAERTGPGGRFATYSAAGWVRRNLEAAGFAVEKRPGFGGKRERLIGALRASIPKPS